MKHGSLQQTLTSKVIRMLVLDFIWANDDDLVNNRRCFPCEKMFHNAWFAIRDLCKTIKDKYEYTDSPAFLESIQGKNDNYVRMAIKIQGNKNKKEFSNYDLHSKMLKAVTNRFV